MEHKQITKKKDLISKTIEFVYIPKEHYRNFCMRFTDGSFVALEIEDLTEGFGYKKERVAISDIKLDSTDIELVNLKVITEAEHKEALRLEEIEREERSKKADEDFQKRMEEMELEHFEKLKNKYGNKTDL